MWMLKALLNIELKSSLNISSQYIGRYAQIRRQGYSRWKLGISKKNETIFVIRDIPVNIKGRRL